MNVRPFDAEERQLLMSELREAFAPNVGSDAEVAAAAGERLDKLQALYYRRLPERVVGCDPFTGEPLLRRIDPYGLDGPWWSGPTGAQEPPAPSNFRLLRGALRLGDATSLPPLRSELRTGPEVPYVIPRILELPGMVMVIGELDLECGLKAYPLSYFSTEPTPPSELAASWPGRHHLYENADGTPGWNPTEDAWDFELRPWIEAGRVRWCEPGSDNRVLSEASVDACPYVDLPGRRAPLRITPVGVVDDPLPTGEAPDPWD